MKTALLCLTLLTAAAIGCTDRTAPAPGGAHKHHHDPPHGGVAVDLGDEDAHLEFLLDAPAGKLTCYVLKPHMSGFQRIAQTSFEVTAQVGGKPENLTFNAVASAASGETVGDTAQFEATAEWLKTAVKFDAEVKSIAVRGKNYQALKFSISAKAPASVNP